MTLESQFADALVVIASGLGIAADRVFGIFVNVQMIIGIIDLVSISIVVGGAYFVAALCYKSLEGDKDADALVTSVVVCVVVAFVLAVIVGLIGDAAVKIACPEYSAMKEVISLVIP